MSSTRREFIRRVVAASFLLATGAVAVWDLFDSGQGGQPPPVTLLPSPTTQTSVDQSATSQQSATSRSATSQESTSSQQSTQQTSQTTTQSSTTSQGTPAGYVLVAAVSALSGKTSAYFNHPTLGLCMLVSVGGQWKAFSATCTHQPCTVQYSGSQIQCPCHGGTFNPSNGAVISGPPPSPLPELGVIIQNGNLYVSGGYI